MVKNEFSRFIIKLAQWIRAGFAVVMLDNRGSFNRGSKFESYIKVLDEWIDGWMDGWMDG